jgi:hypothetical protein
MGTRKMWAALSVTAIIFFTVMSPRAVMENGSSRPGPAVSSPDEMTTDLSWEKVVRAAANEHLALDFYPETAEIAVTDLSSNMIWASNPPDRVTDSIAKGTKKTDLSSQLLLDYVDEQGKPFSVNSYAGSVQERAFSWKKVEDGVEVVFTFPKTGFTVPVRYTLNGDAFIATVLTDRVEQRGEYSLVNIGLLPFFGAGSINDQGYLFVPDGSGALIRFNNNKSIYRSYNEKVYGGDKALDISEQGALKEDIKLPVFGLKKNDHAFVAVIHQGEYQAGIAAEVSGKNNQYNSVYSYLNLMEFETNVLMPGSLNEKQVVRASRSLAGDVPFEVRYYFLDGDQADYTGMANRYKDYLKKEKGVRPVVRPQKTGIPLHLEFLGGIKKRDTFLGIPFNTVEVLTSYSDVLEAAKNLKERGIGNLSISLDGWMSGGMKDEVPTSFDAERKLGGRKGFENMIDGLRAWGIAFYPAVDPIRLFEGGNGFSRFFDTVKGISRAPVVKYEFRLGSGAKNKDTKPWYLLRPESVKEAVEKIAKAAEREGVQHLALREIGRTVYSDFRRSAIPKNDTGKWWEEALKSAKARVPGLLFDHASAYTFPYADHISNVPLYSSRFDVEDETVPFYSIAISGLIPAYGEPINLSSEPENYLLKLIETGTFPAYRLIAREGALLVDTDFDSLYSGDFSLWFDDIVEQYRMLDDALRQVAGQAIVGHEKVAEGVYRTTFANGKSVIVNYNAESVAVGRDRIEAKGYLIR